MAAKKTLGNTACCEGCSCEFCACTCPYMTFLTLVEKLIAKEVCPDTAAEVAAAFVQSQCC